MPTHWTASTTGVAPGIGTTTLNPTNGLILMGFTARRLAPGQFFPFPPALQASTTQGQGGGVSIF